jgi:SAM-dependent methyltransferase
VLYDAGVVERDRVARAIRRALLITVACLFVLIVAGATFLELCLTLLVKVGPGGYTGEDDDHTAWLHLMPWTIGLWTVVLALIVRRVRRRRAGQP